VQITAAFETVGWRKGPATTRVHGPLRDMVQKPLTQMLRLHHDGSARPFRPEAIRNEKAKVAAAARPGPKQHGALECCGALAVTARRQPQRTRQAYRDEPGVNPEQHHRNLGAMKLYRQLRCQGVPFLSAHGQTLPKAHSRGGAHLPGSSRSTFFDGRRRQPNANQLICASSPMKALALFLMWKAPGSGSPPPCASRPATCTFPTTNSSGTVWTRATWRLLADAMRVDPHLYTRADEVGSRLAAVHAAAGSLIEDSPWQLPVQPYEGRHLATRAADSLLASDGLMWRRPELQTPDQPPTLLARPDVPPAHLSGPLRTRP